MSTDLLFEQFATLATAPDGIARLRELILQLAVQGKLGTQNPGDEPASVLLEKIRKGKERVAKDRKIKKEKPLEPQGELIYQLPKTWKSAPLGAIISFEYGESLPQIKREDSGKIPVYGSNGIVGYHSKAITKGPAIIIGRKGSVGAIQISNVPCHPIDTAYFFDNFENLDCKFIFYLLTILKLGSLDKSTAIPGLNRNDAYNLLIGFPPLAEQHRIVAKVDRLMALCDELEARQQQERAGCLKLGTASLTGLQIADSPEEFERQWAQVCDAFELILDCPENVAVLRQTILQIAVIGMMATQDPKDEPVERIIERIGKAKERLVKDGKIKPEKLLESGNEIECPFAIPKTWKWMKLSAISAFVTDGDHYPPQRVLKGIPHLTAKNVRDKKLNLIGCTFISHEDFEKVKMRYEPREDDVIITCVGTIGQTAIVPPNFVFSADRNLAAIRLIEGTFLPKFLQMILNASYWQNKVMTGSESTAQPHLYLKDLRSFCIPLPPLAEQHRIVAKVDALMALCDALESRLKERAATQGKYANAIINLMTG